MSSTDACDARAMVRLRRSYKTLADMVKGYISLSTAWVEPHPTADKKVPDKVLLCFTDGVFITVVEEEGFASAPLGIPIDSLIIQGTPASTTLRYLGKEDDSLVWERIIKYRARKGDREETTRHLEKEKRIPVNWRDVISGMTGNLQFFPIPLDRVVKILSMYKADTDDQLPAVHVGWNGTAIVNPQRTAFTMICGIHIEDKDELAAQVSSLLERIRLRQ